MLNRPGHRTCPPAPGRARGKDAGFTLLELLVVVSILAAVSAIAATAFENVVWDSQEKLVYVEMNQIAKAVRRFKADTGYYPKTGPFALSIDDGGAVQDAGLPDYITRATDALEDEEKRQWFYSPANFYQLIQATSPLAGTSHQLKTWNPETGRGWRGPYLKGFRDGYVDIREGINGDNSNTHPYAYGNPGENPLEDDAMDGSGDIPDVMGVADPFEHKAKPAEYTTAPVGGSVVDETLLDWSTRRRQITGETGDDEDYRPGFEKQYWGRPYLLFGLINRQDEQCHPWLVSMGPDGEYSDYSASNDDTDPADPRIPMGEDNDDIILIIE